MSPNMSLVVPEELQNLESNCGVFAVWMVLQHCEIDIALDQLLEILGYEIEVGTFGIGLAVGLKRLGFDVAFHTDEDLDQHENEPALYQAAQSLNMQIQPALSYAELVNEVQQGAWVIVYYDTLDGVGNHSLIYDIDEFEVQFFDSFEAMPADIFEQQRAEEGICRQTIVIRPHAHFEVESVIYS